MNRITIILAATLVLASCGEGEHDDAATEEVYVFDQTDPGSVIEFIRLAAESGDFSGLEKLCDPDAGSTETVMQICNIANLGADYQQSFQDNFKDLEVTSPPRILGDRCEVSFDFGPVDGRRSEMMKMVLKGENWYLEQF